MADVLIRPVRVEDAEALNAIRRQPGVLAFTSGLPSERISANRDYITGLGANDHDFVAEVGGQVVGTAGITVLSGRMRHVGALGIIIADAHQNQGIGRALMQTLLRLADNDLGLHRVELTVVADNARAIHLYESLGFAHEGCKRQAWHKEGRYVDLLVMGRLRAR